MLTTDDDEKKNQWKHHREKDTAKWERERIWTKKNIYDSMKNMGRIT